MGTRLKAFFAGLFFVALTGFMGYWLGGDLWRDFQHRNDTFAAVNDARISEARCRTRLFVIAFCDVKAEGPGLPGGKGEFSYLIVQSGLGDERVALRREVGSRPARERYLTTTTGMEHLTNRIVSLMVFLGILSALAIGGFYRAVAGER